MALQSETGHAKNLANFKELITVIKTFGAQYQPMADALKIPNLEAQATQADQALAQLKQAETSAKQATATLQEHFKPLNTLSSQIMGLLKSSGAKTSSIEEAKAIQKIITGSNSKKKKRETATDASETTKVTRSQSRQSYDSRLDNFNKLITVLQNISEYKPNEDAFKIINLQAKAQAMQQAIQDNDLKEQIRSQAMNHRNTLLYSIDTGIVDTGLKVKEYIKAIFGGVKSLQFKAVSKIKFNTLKTK